MIAKTGVSVSLDSVRELTDKNVEDDVLDLVRKLVRGTASLDSLFSVAECRGCASCVSRSSSKDGAVYACGFACLCTFSERVSTRLMFDKGPRTSECVDGATGKHFHPLESDENRL